MTPIPNTPAPSPTPRRAWLTPLAILLVGALIGALLALAVGPRPGTLGAPSGDRALAQDAAAALTGTAGNVSVARIKEGQVSWAGFGAVTADSRFEIGSVSKTFVGLLLADGVRRGEVRLDDRLEAHLPELAGTPAGSVTLKDLATHTSGLPGMGPVNMPQITAEDLAGRPYSVYRNATPEGIIADVSARTLIDRGQWRYSNLGVSLLGFALARAADAPDWPSHVEHRLFEPLGMSQTHIAEPGRPAPDLLQPHNPNGRAIGAQTGSGYAPAGIGVTSTAADMTRYAQALLAGTAPGMDALTPQFTVNKGALEGHTMGMLWVLSGAGDHEVTWHNGMTGGMASMFALDRAGQQATIVLADRAHDVTGAGFELLAVGDPGLQLPSRVDSDTIWWVALGALLVLLWAWTSVRATSRLSLVGYALATVGSLLLWGIAQPWDWAPAWTFGLALGLALGGLVVAGRRWRGLGWLPQRWRPVAVIDAVLGAAWFALMVAYAVYVGMLAAT